MISAIENTGILWLLRLKTQEFCDNIITIWWEITWKKYWQDDLLIQIGINKYHLIFAGKSVYDKHKGRYNENSVLLKENYVEATLIRMENIEFFNKYLTEN